MVKFINWLTGTEMYVAEDRVDEYLARGHKLALEKVEVKKAPPIVEEKPKSHKKTAKK